MVNEPATRALPADPTDLTGTGLTAAWVDELVERTLTEDLTGGAPLPRPRPCPAACWTPPSGPG